MKLLAHLIVWPMLLVLAPLAYGIGLLFIFRDLWKRDEETSAHRHPPNL